MSVSKTDVRQIVIAGMIAALYAAMSFFSSIFGIAYGPIQCRFSEALCILPFLLPSATPGLVIGCFIANILSPYGVLDVVFGMLATLIAAVCTQHCRNKWLAPLPPVMANALIVGAVITIQEVPFGIGGIFFGTLAYNALTVGIGEALACYVLGMILLEVLLKIRKIKNSPET